MVAALVAVIGAQQMRINNAHNDLAEEIADRAVENSARMEASYRQSEKLRDLTEVHAKTQQEKLDEHQARVDAVQTADRLERELVRLRKPKIDIYTTPPVAHGEVDSPSCVVAKDRLKRLGEVVKGGNDLVADARRIIGIRDSQVRTLEGIIESDRRACRGAPTESSM